MNALIGICPEDCNCTQVGTWPYLEGCVKFRGSRKKVISEERIE